MTQPHGTPADILPYRATEATLANGLRVIVVPTGFPNLISLQIPVQTGSRNEVEPGKSGFAHFFEHMMFRGTERYSSEQYNDLIAQTGARQNAYTTDDYTNYHMTFAAEDLERMLDVEADRFMHLRYSEEDFKTEARAVLGEYNKNSANPIQKLIELQREHAFRAHPYQHTTMGFLRDIEDMPNQFGYSRIFFDRWYRPEYTTIVVAGDVPPDAVVALVEKYWSAWQRGSFTVAIPPEPPPAGPVAVHVPWTSATLPWVTVAFHGPAFSESDADYAALDMLLDLQFGPTSDVYRRLVEREQKVDQFRPYFAPTADPSLATIMARVKDPADAAYVRDVILEAVARARGAAVDATRLDEAKSNARYGFARTLDNSESIAETLAMFVRFRRSYDTLNVLYRQYDALTPDALLAAARAYLDDARMVVTTLSHEPLPAAIAATPALASFDAASPPAPADAADAPVPAPTPARPPSGVGAISSPFVIQKSPSPLLRVKLLFDAGSAQDPAGREGLAALGASMVADAGSKHLRIDEITRALFPMAGSFSAQVDREMTVFTGVIHRDNADRFADIVLPQLIEPGLREEDFSRVKQRQMNALVTDLRANNEEELAKERLQANIFFGGPYGHPTLGTVAGIDAIEPVDVGAHIGRTFTQASLTIGVTGDAPDAFIDRLRGDLAALPAGAPLHPPTVTPHRPHGLEVEIVRKDTRATAISFGHAIDVTRAHPDFAALWLARAWLGEHRASHGQLYHRIREVRGMNYGDYAYVEAFPRGMYQFFPDANRARHAQLFEVWIRPVPPEQAVFALKVALHELESLIDGGMTPEAFEATRNYLMKNVFVMTKTQDQQLGYALDSRWYGIGEFTSTMRARMSALTVAAVNDALRRHLSYRDLSVVAVTQDADALRAALLSREPATIAYDAPKPPSVLEEDAAIGARELAIRPVAIRITPAEEVFAS